MRTYGTLVVASAFLVYGMTFLKSSHAAAVDGKTVVARQGGEAVDFADIDQFAETIPTADRAHFFDDPNRIQSVLLNLLLQKQLAAEGVKAGLEKDPDVVNAKPSMKPAALAKAEVNRFKSAINIPDLDGLAKEEYIGHPERYVVPGHMTIKDIVISDKTRSDEEAAKLADDVAAQAQKSPSNFDALIEKYSEDPSAGKTRGVLTISSRSGIDEAVVRGARKLPLPSSISSPIKGYAGYHVIMLVERVNDKKKAFDEVRESIVSSLKQKVVDKKMQDHINILRNQPLDANQDLVASLRTRFASVAAEPAEKTSPSPARKPGAHR